jgi:nucleotide-binding universal stress UspA family protein
MMNTLECILVPVDFAPCSQAALEYAAFLAEIRQARVDVLHVWLGPRDEADDPPARERDELLRVFERSDAGQEMKECLERLEQRGLQVHGRVEVSDDPSALILQVAIDDNVDLIAMGTHGHMGISHALLGGVAEAVLRRAPCPVVMLRSLEQALSLGGQTRRAVMLSGLSEGRVH